MQTRAKLFLFLALIILVIAIFAVSANLISKTEDSTYLTPIPESTWSAYHEDMPIDSKFEAVLAATQQIHSWRMVFTQGEPKVMYAEKMNVEDVRDLLRIQYEEPGNTKVWLVIFKGQWQVLPPMVDELDPIETGCINVIVPVNEGNRYMGAGDCKPLP